MPDIAHEVFPNTQAHHSDMCEKMTFINKKEKEFDFKVCNRSQHCYSWSILEIISNKDRTLFRGVYR